MAVLILLSSTVLATLEPYTDGICTFLDFNEMVSVIKNTCENADVICIVANLCQPAGISVETGDTDTSVVVDVAMQGIGYYDMDV